MSLIAALLLGFVSEATAAEPPTFERDVLPILNSHCLQCHGGLHRKAELDLRTISAALAGGKNGKVVTPGDPDASLLWKKIKTDEMPKNPIKVSAEQKEIIRRWIAAGTKSVQQASQFVVPNKPRSADEIAKLIDDEVDRRLAEGKIPASSQADDGEFLRRVRLDVIGRIPTRAEATAFLEDSSPDKRATLIDQLLARPEYGGYWARLWRDRVAVPIGAGEDLKGQYTANFQKWFAEEFNKNRPWDELVRAMITAESEDPPIAFIRQCMDDGQPRANKLAASAAQRFLGIQLQCAECHDHPFATWTQDEFWGLAAFFSRTAKVEPNPKKGENRKGIHDTEAGPPKTRFGLLPLELKDGGAVVIPTDAGPAAGKVVPAKFLGAEKVDLDPQAPPRPVLAEWMTSPKNAMFARATINRLWWQLFGRGLVEPVDSLDLENPATHPELLDSLAGELVAAKFDIKHLLRGMLLSRAYQRSHVALVENEQDKTLYSHATCKVLAPEAFWECLVLSTGGDPDKGAISGASGTTLGSRSSFLNLFDTDEMDGAPSDYTQGVPQVLTLLNDSAMHKQNRLVEQAVREKGEPDEIVTRLYVAVLSRRPREKELKVAREFIAERKGMMEAYQAVWWALVNSPEFAVIP
ncbi:PSD1 and planctomycete cytochrome C domain-containing protein [Anatilimnocola aggregata]|nr:PSD1 and planctomycete cytochrome C domain-containing protein [Anatilimnocola aggregata]